MRPSRLIRPIKRLRRRVVVAVAAVPGAGRRVGDLAPPLFADPVVGRPLPRRRRSKAAAESPEAN